MRYAVVVDTHLDGRVIRGGNHTIHVRNGWIYVHVFKREDVNLEQGARFAQELSTTLTELLGEPDVTGLIVDVRDAPAIAGPKTRACVSELCADWELAERPVAFVVGDQPIKEVQFQGIVSKSAPCWGRVVRAVTEGERWCGQASGVESPHEG